MTNGSIVYTVTQFALYLRVPSSTSTMMTASGWGAHCEVVRPVHD